MEPLLEARRQLSLMASFSYAHFSAGQTEAPELLHLPKVTPSLWAWEPRLTPSCVRLVPEPSWPRDHGDERPPGEVAGVGVWKGRVPLQSCLHFQLRSPWSALPLPGGSYSLQFAHGETGPDRCQGCPGISSSGVVTPRSSGLCSFHIPEAGRMLEWAPRS